MTAEILPSPAVTTKYFGCAAGIGAAAAPAPAPAPVSSVPDGLDFKLSQCFGDCSSVDQVTEADILTAVQFDQTGEYLATGDRGGRIVVFRQNTPIKNKVTTSGKLRRASDFKFFTEFQSHVAEFDYLKSLEIEEKINQIKWCQRAGRSLMLLSTNDKTVKLWRIKEMPNRRFVEPPEGGEGGGEGREGGDMDVAIEGGLAPGARRRRICVPQTETQGTKVCAQPRRVFADAHAYHINAVDPCCDGEHFLSADDLRVNLWNFETAGAAAARGGGGGAHTAVDLKPRSMEELREVVTCAAFHPRAAHVFLCSTSRGAIRVSDLRAGARCDRSVRVMEGPPDPHTKTFFSDIVASISDIKVTQCGQFVVARDYLTLKLWDARMEARPVKTIPVHDHLRPRLCDLYENDCIFDKFECAVSGDAATVVTGSYGNLCSMYSRAGSVQATLEISKDPSKRSSSKRAKRRPPLAPVAGSSIPPPSIPPPLDFDKKILHMSWHPREDVIAVAGLNKLYIYTAQQQQQQQKQL